MVEEGGKLGARVYAELSVDPREVPLDRLRGQRQLAGHLDIAAPGGHE
jgi:hypothetical protein